MCMHVTTTLKSVVSGYGADNGTVGRKAGLNLNVEIISNSVVGATLIEEVQVVGRW